MKFRIDPIVVTGYHGTSRTAAKRILAEGFVPSINDWDWLGHGTYFWQDAPVRAYRWAQERLSGTQEVAVVVAAQIRLDGFFDLLDQRGMKTLQGFAAKFQDRSTQLSNTRGANRLDCAVFNFATSVLSWRGVNIMGYRAACVEGNTLTPGSPIYDMSHVQLVVINHQAILKSWMVPIDEET